MDTIALQRPGTFTLGCNYWASHAGTAMWRDWRPEVVDADLARLAAAGLTVLRVFPLWSDFQPVIALQGGGGPLRELAFASGPLPDDAVGQAGVDPVMLERFAAFAEMAQRHGLGLIVGLITGWMSGELYVPPALIGRNVHTDPLALQCQARFVRCFVQRFRTTPAVHAWDLGNECNCMANPGSRAGAWAWTALITGAIRSADASRPIVSGMHSLLPSPERSGGWTIQDQAELCDILTTHPYPLWTQHASQDPLDSIRTTMHATAETRMYGDIGGRTAFAEEIGTMGPMMGHWQHAANFVRTNLFSLWANDCRGFLWWCAFDQTRLPNTPYDWVAVERELGLFTEDGVAKPMAGEMTAFRDFLKSLPFTALPERRVDAVCILSRGQDQWAAAYSAWILAAQAKLSLRFVWADQPLPSAQRYVLPSIQGVEVICRRRWLALLERVQAGAELYVSLGDGVLAPFTEVFGVEVRSRSVRRSPTTCTLAGLQLTATHGLDLKLEAMPGTTVLAAATDGSAMITSRAYGAGKVTLCAFPVETQLTATPGGFHAPEAQPYHIIYRHVFSAPTRPIDSTSAALAITYHGDHYAVLVNHGDCAADFTLAPGVKIGRWWRGGPQVAAHDAAVVEFID